MGVNWLEPFDMFTPANREVGQLLDDIAMRSDWTREELYYVMGGYLDRRTDQYAHDFFSLRGVLY